jgi:hypothetical protein
MKESKRTENKLEKRRKGEKDNKGTAKKHRDLLFNNQHKRTSKERQQNK